jgi:hypothetical protein
VLASLPVMARKSEPRWLSWRRPQHRRKLGLSWLVGVEALGRGTLQQVVEASETHGLRAEPERGHRAQRKRETTSAG